MLQAKYDVIIVGTGAAGLFAALHLPESKKILMITKDELENSDSYLAQGGISALLNDNDYETYFEDTMKAGRYENNKEAVKEMINASQAIIQDLIDYKVDFDKNQRGATSYTREGGHSTYRILHHQDVTGKEIVTKLLEKAKTCDNIQMEEYTCMLDLISEENSCKGIIVQDKKRELRSVHANDIILATGGLGGLFINSTNFPHIEGDSFSIALRHNVKLENIHYIQIHPTVLYSKKKGRRFLISESVRGEGAILLNENGERFVDELLPRDVVTAAIRQEMDKAHTDHVYLSLEKISKEEILTHFPNIYQKCLEEGYDVTKELVPVTPAQHYLMGGIQADVKGQTSMRHLYAVGETACNGVHGANRLASNSLLESLVFAKNAAIKITDDKEENKPASPIEQELFQKYANIEQWKEENKQILLEEIKRKDCEFYDKWCNIKN